MNEVKVEEEEEGGDEGQSCIQPKHAGKSLTAAHLGHS